MILPAFHHHSTKYQASLFRAPQCCSSGRHGKRGHHANRNHVWWHSQPYHSLIANKQHPPSKRSRIQQGLLCQQRNQLLHNIALTDYYDVTIIPCNMYIHHNDVYYNVQNQPPDWIPSDQPTSSLITSCTITSLVDSIDVLPYYQALKSLGDVSFFNSRYTLLDPSSYLYSRIMIQA
jgi:hypothetical protein